MKIGFTCQGSTDEAFLEGLKESVCPRAVLIKGDARGSSGESFRREIRKILPALREKGAEIFIILNDSDAGKFREIKKRESAYVPEEYKADTVYGIAERNIECWLTADQNYCKKRFGTSPPRDSRFRKKYFVKAMGISARSPKKEDIISFVKDAQIGEWRKKSRSFDHFCRELVVMEKKKNCGRLFINAAFE
ncbi:MAG: hypothetical protein AB1742_06580 [bacterium]